jgi:type IV secretion system protein VirB5
MGLTLRRTWATTAEAADRDGVSPIRSSDSENTSFNPYLAARREWDERYGEIIVRAKNWRFIAILCAFVSLAAVGGIVRLSARSKAVPFVIALDSLGRTVAAGPAEETVGADEKLKKATLFAWIEELLRRAPKTCVALQ